MLSKKTRAIKEKYKIKIPKDIISICEKTAKKGGKALLVGGSVRDAVISREYNEFDLEIKDFDIEVYGLRPKKLHKILKNLFGEVREEGEAFEVLKVSIDGINETVDVSIPRKESKVAPGHKGFEIKGDPAMTISEASLRRDLTMNSLAYDPLTNTLYDPYGGVDDIKKGLIKIINKDTFQEDPLRVFRVMQFAARFKFDVSEITKNLCKRMVSRGDLDELPSERITEEIKKMFIKGRKPSTGLKFALDVGIVESYWQELYALRKVKQDEKWHPEGDVWIHTLQTVNAAAKIAARENLDQQERLVLCLAALTHDFGKPKTTEYIKGRWRSYNHENEGIEPAQTFLNKFDFSEEVKKRVLGLIPDHLSPKYFWEQEVEQKINMDNAVSRLAERLGKANTSIYMLSLLAEADQRARNAKKSDEPLVREEVDELNKWQGWLRHKAEKQKVIDSAPEDLISGHDVLSKLSKKKGGVWLGCVLKAVREDQLDGKLKTREKALETASSYFKKFTELVEEAADKKDISRKRIWETVKDQKDPRKLLDSDFELVELL